MTATPVLAFIAGVLAMVLAGASLVRRTPTVATWLFFAAMAALAAESLLVGVAGSATDVDAASQWVAWVLASKAATPALWLGFSLAYSRADGRARVVRWAPALGALATLPFALTLTLRNDLVDVLPLATPPNWHVTFRPIAAVLNGAALVTLVFALLNLEQTFRSSVGTMRWRLKYVVLALVVVLGTRLYVHSQGLLFSAPDMAALWGLEAVALLIGCAFLTLAHTRTGTGWTEVTVYPSSAVVRSSLTILVVGGYLFTVGVLAQVVGHFGGETFFLLQTTVVLVALTGLALLVLSDRARQRLRTFTARHFGKAQHDSVRVWTMVSEQMGRVADAESLGKVSARLIADTFDVLSVNVWLVDHDGRLQLAAATGRRDDVDAGSGADASAVMLAGLANRTAPFDLDDAHGEWAGELRRLNPTTFPNGGHRLCVPLRAGERVLGALVLADRVNGTAYTVEELELLRCTAAQSTSVLLNLRLAEEVARTRELDAFHTMSTFFVHDLKNAAASLNLMLRNMPVHFDDPAFRQDALRGLSNAASRIDSTIERLNAVRQRPEIVRMEADLNSVVTQALDEIGNTAVPVSRSLEQIPLISGDPDQLRSVVANLVMNAHDAVGSGGKIEVHTCQRPGEVVLSVSDNGCGMSPAFVSESLFRPFQTTKKSGLGIGLFQTRAIVQSHGGRIHVDSEEGRGTTFTAVFPASGP